MQRHLSKIVCLIMIIWPLDLACHAVAEAKRSQPFLIGALTVSWGPTPGIIGLRDGLVKLGYVDNEDFVIGVRFTQGKLNAFPTAVKELIQLGADLLYVEDIEAARAAQQATTRLPIIFAGSGNPIDTGLVKSFDHPGGNLTGVTNMELHLGPKRLQLFQEMIPHLKRVIFPYNSADAYAPAMAKSYREASQSLGIHFVAKALHSQEEAAATLPRLRRSEVDGILAPWSPGLNIPGLILEVSAQQHIPAIFSGPFYSDQGGLASYAPDSYETGRQTARIVDKIINGAEPAKTPIEVNEKIEFIINLKTAKSWGLTISPEILYQADRIIR